MTNKQLAAARRAMSAYPDMVPLKSGKIITPSRRGVLGVPVTVTESMSETDVSAQLMKSCEALLD